MVNTVLVYEKGSTYGSITVISAELRPELCRYQESDLDTAVLTISGSDIETLTTSSLDFKKSALSTLARDNYIVKVVIGDGSVTDIGRFEMRVV